MGTTEREIPRFNVTLIVLEAEETILLNATIRGLWCACTEAVEDWELSRRRLLNSVHSFLLLRGVRIWVIRIPLHRLRELGGICPSALAAEETAPVPAAISSLLRPLQRPVLLPLQLRIYETSSEIAQITHPLRGDEVAEADGRETDEAEVEGLEEGPVFCRGVDSGRTGGHRHGGHRQAEHHPVHARLPAVQRGVLVELGRDAGHPRRSPTVPQLGVLQLERADSVTVREFYCLRREMLPLIPAISRI